MKKVFIGLLICVFLLGFVVFVLYSQCSGIIDLEGNVIVPLNHKNVSSTSFSKKINKTPVACGYKNGKYKYYDKNGEYLFSSDYKLYHNIEDGFAVCSKFKYNEWDGLFQRYDKDLLEQAAIDYNGNVWYKNIHSLVVMRSLGTGKILTNIKQKDGKYRTGVYDLKKSECIIEHDCMEIDNSDKENKKYVLSAKKGDKYCVLDIDCNETIPPVFDYPVGDKIKDYYLCYPKNGKRVLCDKNGKIICKNISDCFQAGEEVFVYDTDEKLFRISEDKSYPLDLYFISRDADYILVKDKNRKIFMIDSKLNRYFENMDSEKEMINITHVPETDLFIVQIGSDSYSIIKKTAKSFSQTLFSVNGYIYYDPDNKYFIYENSEEKGIIDLNGNVLLKDKYMLVNEKYIVLGNDEKTVIYDNKLNKIMETDLTDTEIEGEFVISRKNSKVINIKDRKTYNSFAEYIISKGKLSKKDVKKVKNAYIDIYNENFLIITNPIVNLRNAVKIINYFIKVIKEDFHIESDIKENFPIETDVYKETYVKE